MAANADDLGALFTVVSMTRLVAGMVATLGSGPKASRLTLAAVAARIHRVWSILDLVTGTLAHVIATRQPPVAVARTRAGLGHEAWPVGCLVASQAGD